MADGFGGAVFRVKTTVKLLLLFLFYFLCLSYIYIFTVRTYRFVHIYYIAHRMMTLVCYDIILAIIRTEIIFIFTNRYNIWDAIFVRCFIAYENRLEFVVIAKYVYV